MSTLKVDTILKRTGTGTITLGQSGDTISIPSGTTLAVTGTATGVGGENTPAFFAYLSSNQNPSQNVFTKVTFDTEDYDSDGTYDNTTNYRFTPAVAGKYLVFAQIETYGSNVSNLNYNNTRIMKNGSEYMTVSPDHRNNMPYGALSTVQAIMDLNTTDYVEIFARAHDQGDSTLTFSGNSGRPCFFGAYKLI